MKIAPTFLLLLICFISKSSFADSVDVELFPNPNTGKFMLRIDNVTEAQQATLVVYNLTGQALSTLSIQLAIGTNTVAVNQTQLANGVYIAKVSGKGWTFNQRIVISKNDPIDSLDAVHYNLNLSIRNLATISISGKADITLAVTAASVQSIKLDLLKLTADSVVVDGNVVSFSQTDSTLSIQLSATKLQGDTFILSVYYKGQPVTDASWGGFYFNGNYAYNMGVAFTSKPHNFGRCWFPCFDNFTDRATYSFHVTADAGFKAVCNGLMLPETLNGDGSTTWNWELNQAIPTYLASVAVGQYEFVKYTFTGINRTYPVWLAVVAADTAKARASFTNLNNALVCFESKFGVYPFDRVGYVGVPFTSGAMEHATNIAYPLYAINGNTNYETLMAHELSHMWWGNHTTCRTAEDMWLNEGWASFCEALFLECMYGKEAYISDIKTKTSDVLLNAPSDDGGWLPVSGVPHNSTYGTHVYKKGALMVHTLRTLMGDSAFFAACKHYQLTYPYQDVNSEDLKNTFQAFTTINLTNFFDKWIYSPGHSDVVLSGYAQNGNAHHFDFMELNRLNSIHTASLPFRFKVYLSNNTIINRLLTASNGQASFDTSLPQGISIVDYGINEDYGVYLAHMSQKQSIATTGSMSFADVLASINVQTAGAANDSLTITHHWVGPLDANLRAKGIRISKERYWTVQGKLSEGFKAWGFLSYNGSSNQFLDKELITQTEDSLVLLYRPNPNIDWAVHTDHTFQPGPSKTDKVGRFWVNNLVQGEYAFGIRDYRVTAVQELVAQPKNGVTIYITPNPTVGDSFTLHISKPIVVNRMRLVNTAGKTVWQKQLNQLIDTYEIATENVGSGMYVLVVESGNQSFTAKFTRP